MANHCKVTTRRKMTPEAISELIDRLNKTVFKNILDIKYFKSKKGDRSKYGEHVWQIEAKEDDFPYVERIFWLNNPYSFEIRHGGGLPFAWWVDHCITNEVAVQFNGTEVDDSDGVKRKGEPKKYSTYKKYRNRYFSYLKKKSRIERNFHLQVNEREIPAAFRDKRIETTLEIRIEKVGEMQWNLIETDKLFKVEPPAKRRKRI